MKNVKTRFEVFVEEICTTGKTALDKNTPSSSGTFFLEARAPRNALERARHDTGGEDRSIKLPRPSYCEAYQYRGEGSKAYGDRTLSGRSETHTVMRTGYELYVLRVNIHLRLKFNTCTITAGRKM